MSDFDYDGPVQNARLRQSENNEKFVYFKDRDGNKVKIEGESTLFNLENQKSLEVNYTSIKSGTSLFDNARTKNGEGYKVEWGYLETTDNDGNKQKIKNLEFDTDGDGIADIRYKVSSLQDGKVKAHKIRHDSEYFNKKLLEALQEPDIDKRNKKLDKLKKKMRKAGISEETIESKLGQKKPKLQSVQAVSSNESFFKTPEANLSPIAKEAIEAQRTEKITQLMEQYNMAVADSDVHEAQKIIKDIAQINLSDENKELIKKLSKTRNPLTTIEYIQANNEYDKTLSTTDFARLDKTVEGLKHLRNYEQIKAQYESIKADAINQGYYNPSEKYRPS